MPRQVPVRSGGSALASFGRTWASRIFFRRLIQRGTSATGRLLSTTNERDTQHTHSTLAVPTTLPIFISAISPLSPLLALSSFPPSASPLLPRSFPPHRAPAINAVAPAVIAVSLAENNLTTPQPEDRLDASSLLRLSCWLCWLSTRLTSHCLVAP